MSNDLYFRISRSFSEHAERVLVEEKDRRSSYREVESLAARLAASLRNLGVRAGDRVLAQTAKSTESLILYFAVLRIGAIYLPLNTDYTQSEIAYFVEDAEPTLVLCRPQCVRLFDRFASDGLTVRTLEDLLASLTGEEAPPVSRDPDDVAAILYTSGTTGKPKGAMLTNRNLVSNGETLAELWAFTRHDRLIHALPIFHVHGLFVAVHCAVFSGATLMFLPKFEAGAVIERLPYATVFMGVPTYYMRLLADPDFTRESAANMRLFVAGSAPLSADTFRAFEERTGQRVLERYGMTETGMLTSNPYAGERRAGSVGRPLPGVALRVVDKQSGDALPRGEIGIVEVQGQNVFKGYWRMPEKTQTEFRDDGFFITGDLGFVDSDGYVHLVGRSKDLIITGGFNVYPAEVEAVLDDRADVVESAVIGVPHPDLGEAVIAVVQTTSGAIDKESTRMALKEQLAGFKVPKEILVTQALPRNTMGKIHKNALREQYAELFSDA